MTTLALTVDTERLQQAMARAPVRLVSELNRAIGRIVLEMARAAKRKAPKATSLLTNAIGGLQVSPIEGLVFAGVDYASAVEQGTGIYGPQGAASGRMPPTANILDWIKVKRIQPDDPHMSPRDLAFVIARSIARKGTPAQPFMAPAFKENSARAERRIEAAIERALK